MTTLWNDVLRDLRGSMTRAVFDAWLSRTTAKLEDDSLTVYVANDQAREWLEQRLHPIIARAVENLGGPTDITYQVKPQQQGIPVELEGVYGDSYTAIVKPEKVFVGTQYFKENWLPVLGPTLSWLILYLRQKCYWNKKTGEMRDECKASYAELAAAIGVSISTARRALAPGPLVDLFILKRQTIRHYQPKTGRFVNERTLWQIRLDEPIFRPEEHLVVKMTTRSLSSSQNDHSGK